MVVEIREGKNGLRLRELASSGVDVRATATIDRNSKIVLTGKLSIDRSYGSWKYGDELQIDVWSTTPVSIKSRTSETGNLDYYRVQIALPLDTGIKMLKDALAKLESELIGQKTLL